ncbi:MAG: aromatic amino acid transport family protein [Candidatus Aenigmatarchaeota archaeon]
MNRELITLIYLILSTMIGAGILALPSISYSVGIFLSIILYLISTFLIYIVSIILLRASLKYYKTNLIEVFERYLGKNMKNISFILVFLSILFVCIAYLNVINFSLSYFISNSEICTLFIVAIIMSISFIGFNLIEKSEKILFLIKILILLLFLSLITFVPKKYEVKYFVIDITKIFNFLLVSIFAFSFYTVIPSLLLVTKDEKILKNSIIYSIIIGFILYFIFSYFVSLRSGEKEISTLNYNELFNLLTIFLVITPYLILSWILSENLTETLKIEKRISLLISYGLPYILFIFLPKSFLIYLEITSAFFILTIYFLIGIIGYKFSKKLKVNKLYSIFLIVFSLILILFKTLDLLII